MGKVLKRAVALRPNTSSRVEVFFAGQELPDWAENLVGEHLFTEEKTPNPSQVGPKKTGLPTPPPKEEVKPAATKRSEVPSKSASKATWKKFADQHGVEVPEDASRDDIVLRVEAKFPELKD